MEDDWLAIGVDFLRRCADVGEQWAAAVLDEINRLRQLERGGTLDTDAAFVDAAPYTQTMTNEVLR